MLLERVKPGEPIHFVLLRMKDHVATRVDIVHDAGEARTALVANCRFKVPFSRWSQGTACASSDDPRVLKSPAPAGFTASGVCQSLSNSLGIQP